MMGHKTTLFVRALCLATLAACSGNLADGQNQAKGSGGSTSAAQPFVAFTPDVYVSRAKNILTGEVATQAEISAVAADNAALPGIITSWQQSAGYQQKLLKFLSQSLQQSNVVATDFDDQGVTITNLMKNQTPLLLGNLSEMMARTTMALDAQNQPFDSAMTTRSFMMTSPLVAYYAYLDHTSYTDQGSRTNSNANNMLQSVFNGFAAADYTNWRMVSIRQPNAGEATTDPNNNSTSTLVLNTPRMGFWSTPAFFAGWQTNGSNQARVTMNQALIVALGHAFDGTQVTQPPSLAALDSVHAAPSTPCYGCHINLDPMRQIYRQAYSLHFSPQTDTNQKAMYGQFGFDGVSLSLASVYDFGMQLAAHPAMAGAWVQKVCTWANDAPCVTTDSEFVRIAAAFKASGSLGSMIRDIFSSPMTTYASVTDTAVQTQQILPVAKLDHLCPLLATRLGLSDPCGLAVGAAPSGSNATIQQIARVLPANNYSRGQVPPVEANDPTLFFRSATENICSLLAAQLVDATGSPYSSQDALGSVQKMVTGLMGMTDSNADTVRDKLMAHYEAALADKTDNPTAPATNALRSTFVVACLSPAVMGVGLTL